MDILWIRPAYKPVHPSEVEDLSDSALKLLRALELRFHQRHTGAFYQSPQTNDRPGCLMNVQSQIFSQSHVRHNSFNDIPTVTPWSGNFNNIRPDVRNDEPFPQIGRSPHVPYHGSVGSLSHLSQTTSHQLRNLNPSSPVHSRTEKESSWEELSDIFEERNDGTLRQHRSESVFDEVSQKEANPSVLHSKSSSPMSAFDVSVMDQRNSYLEARSWPEPPLNRDEVIRLTNERGGEGFIRTHETSNAIHNFPENNAISEANEEDDISLYESIGSQSFGSDNNNSPHSVNLVQQMDMRKLPTDRPVPQDFDFQQSDRIEGNNTPKSSSNRVQNLLDSSPLFDRTFSLEEELTQPVIEPAFGANDVSASNLLNNTCSPDFFQDSAEDEGLSKQLSENREKLDRSTESTTTMKITPDQKVKKFLGNTFKRAIRSSCLSKMRSSENLCNSIKEPQSANIEKTQLVLNNEEISEKSVSIETVREQNVGKLLTPERVACQNQTKLLHHLKISTVQEKIPKDPVPTSYFPNFNITEGVACQNKTKLLHHLEISTVQEKIPKDPVPTPYFPIFNTTNETKRKHDVREETSSTGIKAPCRKKLKFMVPYKKQGSSMREESTGSVSTAKSIQELATKLSKQVSEKFDFVEMSEKLANDISKKIDASPPQEISLTVLYREGYCQLNRPKDHKISHPDKVLLRFVWAHDVQYISLGLLKTSWSSAFLKKLLSDKSRKICYEAQEIIQLFVDKFGFTATEVASQWIILDPLVGCWLLNSDEPPHYFKDVLIFLKVPEESNGAGKLLSKLSQCAEVLYENLTKFGLWKLFLHIEMRVTPILACMELHGIKVDQSKLQDMASLLKGRLENVQREAYKAAGRQFQLTSPQQLSAILYDNLKLDVKYNISVKETGKQHKSTSEAMLNKFKNLHPLPGIVLEFRGLHKLKTTYVDAVLGHLSGDSIYTTWDQISAATGRITSNEPNLQAIPKQPLMPDLHLRTAFVARDGFSFLAADFQHIELRVFAHLSKDAALISALNQKIDVFKILSKEWLQIADVDKVSDEDRDKTKRIVYALMYGAGPSKLVEFLQIDHNYACQILKKFSDAFPKMQDFTKNTLDLCRKQGFLATASGRRRSFPHIKSENFHLRTHSERQAVNFLIQGMAADLCKCAMVHTQRNLASVRGVNQFHTTRLLLQIHDELLWEVPDSDLLQVTDVLQEAMEGATLAVQSMSSFSVPLPVVMKTGKTWGEMNIAKTTLLGPSQQP